MINSPQQSYLQNAFSLKQESEEIEFAKQLGVRPLIILFDPLKIEGSRSTAVAKSLISALQSKSAPIIVSRGVWNCILKHKQKIEAQGVWNCILKHKQKIETQSDQYLLIDQRFITLCKNLAFDPEAWNVYTSQDQAMLLFTPITKLVQSALIPSQLSSSTKVRISRCELLLGLKTSTLKQIANPLELSLDLNASPTSDNLKTYLQEMLVTRADLQELNKYHLNHWDIYLSGHGSAPKDPSDQKGIIAGMPVKTFESCLDFCNNNLLTRTLLYLSCFSGGSNLTIPYQFLNGDEIKNKHFNFTIIAASTFEHPIELTVTDQGLNANFARYFHDINAYMSGKPEATLVAALKQLTEWDKSLHLTKSSILQIPTIRLPNTDSFTVMDVDKKLFRLVNNIIIRTINQGKQNIQVPSAATHILLESRYIPIPLTISNNSMPLLIPKEVKNTSYFLKKIIAPHINLIGESNRLKNFWWGPFTSEQQFGIATMFTRLIEDKKLPCLGKFFIEQLIIKLDNQYTETDTLGWGDEPLTFEHVLIDPARLIYVQYKGQSAVFDFSTGYWTTGTDLSMPFKDYNKHYAQNIQTADDVLAYFQEAKSAIQQQSTLPAQFKTNESVSGVDITLWHRYNNSKDDSQKMKRLRRMLSSEENIQLDRLMRMASPANQ